MNRVATASLHSTMSASIQRNQGLLQNLQQQLSTGKVASDLAGLGSKAVRNLSAHSFVSAHEAQVAASKQVGEVLSLYELNISEIEAIGETLRQDILTIIGNEDGSGLQETTELAFNRFRSVINAVSGGMPLFGGAGTQQPFSVDSFGQAETTTSADAFRSGAVRLSVRVADDRDMEYGILAEDVGTGLYEAFRALATAGPFSNVPTDSQLADLSSVVDTLNGALKDIRAVNADNGRRQAQAETLVQEGEKRILAFTRIIAEDEDVDLGQVAMELAQHQATLQASYSVFSRLSSLSLTDYI